MDATGAAGSDPGWDLIAGSGTLAISATDLNPFTIFITSLALSNLAGEAVNFSNIMSYAWLIADFGVEIDTFSTDAFFLDSSGFANVIDPMGQFSIVRGDSVSGGENTQLYITYAVIPESGPALLGAIGMLLLLRRR